MSQKHVVRATAVFTFNDGSQAVYLLEGDPSTELSVDVEHQVEEVHSLASAAPIRQLPTGYSDVRFSLRNVLIPTPTDPAQPPPSSPSHEVGAAALEIEPEDPLDTDGNRL